MNALGIQVTVPLSFLDALGGNNYGVYVKMLNSSGGPLNSPYVANNNPLTVNTLGNTFTIKVPVSDASYTLSNFKVQVFANDQADCCFAESGVVSKTNTASSTPQNTLEIGGYFSSN